MNWSQALTVFSNAASANKKACAYCGGPMTIDPPRGPKRRFCSKTCNSKFHYYEGVKRRAARP